MSASGDNAAPVIIKRKKIVKGDGHHGGAWKVAYADFVTAMMAFFLLMWLLNATTEKQRKGIADYFTPTVAINRISGGGEDNFSGDSTFSEERLARNGTGASHRHPTEANQARGETGLSEAGTDGTPDGGETGSDIEDSLKEVEELLLGRAGESRVSQEANKHILTRVTDEGLIIELFDLEEAQLFTPETAEATPLLVELAGLIGEVGALVENRIAVEGHARARPVVVADSPVWRLSSDRADAMRELLEAEGIRPARLRRVTGHADREPATRNPLSIRNNRLEVILLRSDGTNN
ncbi:MAG: flagellar motor protein MotB [Roseovarius indicus]